MAPFAINTNHLRSVRGILQIAQAVVCLLVLICLAACACHYNVVRSSDTGFMYFTAVVGLLASIALLGMFLVELPHRMTKLPFALVGLGFSAAWTFCFFVSFILAAVDSSRATRYTGNTHSALGATAFFCLLALVAYAADAFFYFKDFRSGGYGASGVPPPGVGGVTTQQTPTGPEPPGMAQY